MYINHFYCTWVLISFLFLSLSLCRTVFHSIFVWRGGNLICWVACFSERDRNVKMAKYLSFYNQIKENENLIVIWREADPTRWRWAEKMTLAKYHGRRVSSCSLIIWFKVIQTYISQGRIRSRSTHFNLDVWTEWFMYYRNAIACLTQHFSRARWRTKTLHNEAAK